MKIVLLRHGMTGANERRLYCGFTDVELSEKGREGLLLLKKRISYPDISGYRIITSGMRRADETLRILFEKDPDARMPEFREMNFGSFEMHSYDELKDQCNYQAWIGDETGTIQTPGGESSAQFQARIISAAESIKENSMIICHGGVIAALMQHWFAREDKNMYQWQPGFGMGYAVELEKNFRSYCMIGSK